MGTIIKHFTYVQKPPMLAIATPIVNVDFLTKKNSDQASYNPAKLEKSLYQNFEIFSQSQTTASTQNDTDMEEESQEEDPLAALLDEIERDQVASESDDEWEEVEEFDPDESVFGSEHAAHNNDSLLGKRQRDLDYETVEIDEEMPGYTTFSGPSKAFLGASDALARGFSATAQPKILRPVMRRQAAIFMPSGNKALYG